MVGGLEAETRSPDEVMELETEHAWAREVDFLRRELVMAKQLLLNRSFRSGTISEADFKFYTGFKSRSIFLITWEWLEPFARTIRLTGKQPSGIRLPKDIGHDHCYFSGDGEAPRRQLPLIEEFFGACATSLGIIRARSGLSF